MTDEIRPQLRAYSVVEIDEMRASVAQMYPIGGSYQRAERAVETENRLRTYMQNGTSPEELKEASAAYLKKEFENFEHRRDAERRMMEASR